MSRENTYSAIILKKQPLNEADEIVTFFTKESGKVRALAKASKFAKSKLQYSLQSLFLVKVRTTTKGLPKIIGVEVVNSFANIRGNFEAVKTAYYAAELMLKFTPDEQKNEALFDLGGNFLSFLSQPGVSGSVLAGGLVKFKMAFLESLGLSIHYQAADKANLPVFFSNSRGSFLFGQTAQDAMAIGPELFRRFVELGRLSFGEILNSQKKFDDSSVSQLQQLLANFITYQLEREVKSEKYLNL